MLSFDDSEFSLSSRNLVNLYYELGEYERILILCQDARNWKLSGSPPSNEIEYLNLLSTLRLLADALVMLRRGDESFSFYMSFFWALDKCEGILDKPFEEQQAIISQLSFPVSKYVYKSLRELLLKHQDKIDDAIACYEL